MIASMRQCAGAGIASREALQKTIHTHPSFVPGRGRPIPARGPKYNTYRKNPPFLTGLLSFDDSSGSPYDDDDGHDLRSGAPATDTRDMG